MNESTAITGWVKVSEVSSRSRMIWRREQLGHHSRSVMEGQVAGVELESADVITLTHTTVIKDRSNGTLSVKEKEDRPMQRVIYLQTIDSLDDVVRELNSEGYLLSMYVPTGIGGYVLADDVKR